MHGKAGVFHSLFIPDTQGSRKMSESCISRYLLFLLSCHYGFRVSYYLHMAEADTCLSVVVMLSIPDLKHIPASSSIATTRHETRRGKARPVIQQRRSPPPYMFHLPLFITVVSSIPRPSKQALTSDLRDATTSLCSLKICKIMKHKPRSETERTVRAGGKEREGKTL